MLEKWQSYNHLCYRYDPNTLIFIGEDECALDPLESEINKKEIYSLSANCTFEKPLERKDGYNIIFNIKQNKWKYKKIIKETSNKIRINNLQHQLDSTDWYVTRYLETGKEIPQNIKEERNSLRNEISKLREKLNKGE